LGASCCQKEAATKQLGGEDRSGLVVRRERNKKIEGKNKRKRIGSGEFLVRIQPDLIIYNIYIYIIYTHILLFKKHGIFYLHLPAPGCASETLGFHMFLPPCLLGWG